MMSSRQSHRGAVLMAATFVLALVSLSMLTAVRASGDDAWTASLRSDSIRALYAAESGVEIAVWSLIDDPRQPYSGPTTLPSGAVVAVIDAFDDATPHDAVAKPAKERKAQDKARDLEDLLFPFGKGDKRLSHRRPDYGLHIRLFILRSRGTRTQG